MLEVVVGGASGVLLLIFGGTLADPSWEVTDSVGHFLRPDQKCTINEGL